MENQADPGAGGAGAAGEDTPGSGRANLKRSGRAAEEESRNKPKLVRELGAPRERARAGRGGKRLEGVWRGWEAGVGQESRAAGAGLGVVLPPPRRLVLGFGSRAGPAERFACPSSRGYCAWKSPAGP